MKNLSDYAGQSHETALIHEGEPITITPTVELTQHGIILTLGNINMYMTTDSAITLSDLWSRALSATWVQNLKRTSYSNAPACTESGGVTSRRDREEQTLVSDSRYTSHIPWH